MCFGHHKIVKIDIPLLPFEGERLIDPQPLLKVGKLSIKIPDRFKPDLARATFSFAKVYLSIKDLNTL